MSSSPRLTRPKSRERISDNSGFTLVEVLVAFSVMAMLLSVLLRGVVGMRAGAIAFDDHTHREILAGAVLDDALADRELAPGHYGGLREGYRWTLIANAIDLTRQLPPPKPDNAGGTAQRTQGAPESVTPASAKAALPMWRPQRLIVRIEAKGGPVEIETVRLVKAEDRP